VDRISVRGLEVFASHGCIPQEKTLGQKFLINADLYINLKIPAKNDELADSVNYADVCDKIIKWMHEYTCNMIETAADLIARRLLREYPLLTKAVVEIEKPHAPVPFHFDTIIAHVERERHIVFLGLGSNLGKREENIADVVEMLDDRSDINVLMCSELYETKPYGYKDQPDFINACAKIETFLEPEQLLAVINMIENSCGRVRDVHWGPRTIDIDILFYDDRIIDTEDLHIPHIDLQNRLFVLQPLSEIGAYLRHPYLGKTVSQLLDELEKKEMPESE